MDSCFPAKLGDTFLKKKKSKITIGWREWVAFPDISVRRIKAKIDTGARTSALHAWNIREIERDGKAWVEFDVHPAQRNNRDRVSCIAPIVGQRKVKSSSGHHEVRYVIMTNVKIADKTLPIEITLTNRDEMGFRLLLGRTAIRGRYIVDPGKSYLLGK